jgi:hypothetical protein
MSEPQLKEFAGNQRWGRFPSWCYPAIVLLTTALLYLPGLKGTYFFDDYPNIVDNVNLHVATLDWPRWWQAIWSSPSSDLQRPLATLSFALNYFVDGLNPWPMKAVNLGIHLLNGSLLYLLLVRLIALVPSEIPDNSRNRILALLVSGAWLVHPINLTAVLYVVQREESLAQVFVLIGLLLYVEARTLQLAGKPGGTWRIWLGVPLATALGVLSKETAVLLPLYALIVELTVIQAQREKTLVPRRRSLVAFFLLFLIAPAILGLAWLLPHLLSSGAYSGRSFTLVQRLLTEPRVLVDYVGWTLLPLPGDFSFYHDNISVSTSLFSPWTTLSAILTLIGMLVVGVVIRKRRPLCALGIFWFFAAHAMTATIIPLELVFEHRNYFASAGLLLAMADLLLPFQRKPILPLARYSLAGAFVLLCSFTLFLRTSEWSNPVSLALSEATLHPDSPRALYEYARTLVVLSGYNKESPLIPRAFEALSKAAKSPGSSILPEVGLIMLASHTAHPVDAGWWQEIREKLAEHPSTAEDDAALKTLTQCQREGHCAMDDEAMLKIYLAAMRDGSATPANLYSYAIFAHNRLHDDSLALRLANEAANKSPNDPQYRLNLINFLIDLGDAAEARSQVLILKKQDRFGRLEADVAEVEQKLRAMQ